MPALYIIIYLGIGIAFGFASQSINENKGYEGGFLWGFLLGVIGIIVVACKPERQKPQEITRQPQFYDSGLAQPVMNPGEWVCKNCGRHNQNYTGSCACGFTKEANNAYTGNQYNGAGNVGMYPVGQGYTSAPLTQPAPGYTSNPLTQPAPGYASNPPTPMGTGYSLSPNAPMGQGNMAGYQAQGAAPKSSSYTAADEIKKYKALLDQGILTEDEFNQKKKQLLGL